MPYALASLSTVSSIRRGFLTPIEAQVVKSMHEVRLNAQRYKELASTDNFDTPEAYNLFQMHANEIGTKQIRISTSDKVGRIFHTGNQCDRRLRQLFTCEGRRLIELDAVSMHPQLLTKHCTDYKERARLSELASNDFYSLFAFLKDLSRDDIKTAFNAYLNGATRHSKQPCDKQEGIYGLDWVRMIFEQAFPILTASIEADRVRKRIGRELQQFESSVFIKTLGQWAVDKDKFFIPIHDAVICDLDDVTEVIKMIMDGFKEIIGYDLQLSFKDKLGAKQIIRRKDGKLQITLNSPKTRTMTIDDINNEETKGHIIDLFLMKHIVDPSNLNPFWVNQLEIQGIEAVADDGSIYVSDGFSVPA